MCVYKTYTWKNYVIIHRRWAANDDLQRIKHLQVALVSSSRYIVGNRNRKV